MFAILGKILLDILSSPETMDWERDYDYAEHKVIEGKPKLQFQGEGLETVNMALQLHSMYGNPTLRLQGLRDAAMQHEALALVYGNGEHHGWFVIASLKIEATQLSDTGSMLVVMLTIALKEYDKDQEIQMTKPGPAAVPTTPTPSGPAKVYGLPGGPMPVLLPGPLVGPPTPPPAMPVVGISPLPDGLVPDTLKPFSISHPPAPTPITPGGFSDLPLSSITRSPGFGA